MNAAMKNLSVEWRKIGGLECLVFVFKGMLTYEEALRGVEEWKIAFASRSDQKITIVWHCLEMNNYEPMARNLWQKTLKEMGNQIGKIWLVSASPIINAGATLISLFTSYPIKAVRSEADIRF